MNHELAARLTVWVDEFWRPNAEDIDRVKEAEIKSALGDFLEHVGRRPRPKLVVDLKQIRGDESHDFGSRVLASHAMRLGLSFQLDAFAFLRGCCDSPGDIVMYLVAIAHRHAANDARGLDVPLSLESVESFISDAIWNKARLARHWDQQKLENGGNLLDLVEPSWFVSS